MNTLSAEENLKTIFMYPSQIPIYDGYDIRKIRN